jgi:hypothetical protein
MISPIMKRAAELLRLLKQAKKLAKRYRELTGRPLVHHRRDRRGRGGAAAKTGVGACPDRRL